MSTNGHQFAGICTRIGLNVPSRCAWCWDEAFGTARVVIDRRDGDLVYFPLTQEFDDQWDAASIDRAPPHFLRYFNRVFGIVPGQKIFSAGDGDGPILFAVWWPWGDGVKISLRVGLFSPAEEILDRRRIKTHLFDWFHL